MYKLKLKQRRLKRSSVFKVKKLRRPQQGPDRLIRPVSQYCYIRFHIIIIIIIINEFHRDASRTKISGPHSRMVCLRLEGNLVYKYCQWYIGYVYVAVS